MRNENTKSVTGEVVGFYMTVEMIIMQLTVLQASWEANTQLTGA